MLTRMYVKVLKVKKKSKNSDVLTVLKAKRSY